jgi:hypothetical protein
MMMMMTMIKHCAYHTRKRNPHHLILFVHQGKGPQATLDKDAAVRFIHHAMASDPVYAKAAMALVNAEDKEEDATGETATVSRQKRRTKERTDNQHLTGKRQKS